MPRFIAKVKLQNNNERIFMVEAEDEDHAEDLVNEYYHTQVSSCDIYNTTHYLRNGAQNVSDFESDPLMNLWNSLTRVDPSVREPVVGRLYSIVTSTHTCAYIKRS